MWSLQSLHCTEPQMPMGKREKNVSEMLATEPLELCCTPSVFSYGAFDAL